MGFEPTTSPLKAECLYAHAIGYGLYEPGTAIKSRQRLTKYRLGADGHVSCFMSVDDVGIELPRVHAQI